MLRAPPANLLFNLGLCCKAFEIELYGSQIKYNSFIFSPARLPTGVAVIATEQPCPLASRPRHFNDPLPTLAAMELTTSWT